MPTLNSSANSEPKNSETNPLNELFVVCPKGLQYALETELVQLGVTQTKPIPSGVHCSANQEVMYRVLLWSRIASRVIVVLGVQRVDSVEDIYRFARSLDWGAHLTVETSFSVEFSGTNRTVRNSTFGALKIKDALVDQFRENTGVRPNVSRDQPQIRISARLAKGYLSLGIDLSGESLHKRGYRAGTGPAPLKENLAAGLLRLAGWPQQFDQTAGFMDPMCGSGTLLIEAALARLDKAPCLEREQWGFEYWRKHSREIWEGLVKEAGERFEQARKRCPVRLVGFDTDAKVVHRAWLNIQKAGLEEFIHVEKRPLSEFKCFEKVQPGLLLTNPPYGERLGDIRELGKLYETLGQVFSDHLNGWRAGVFTGNRDLGQQIAWHSYKQYSLHNGAIESQLLLFDLKPENRFKQQWRDQAERLQDPGYWKVFHTERAQMLANRLQKNRKALSRWATKNGIDCYRLYDADMPEFSFAIDVYTDTGGGPWLHVQEYAAPKKVDTASALERLREGLAVIRDTLSIPAERMVLKQRSVQKGRSQYEKTASRKLRFWVQESDQQFLVNLSDYLDTGLFLDHRPVRRWVTGMAKDKRFLNLFCYTASVTVAAAAGGASKSLSIDMSRTYLDWARDNLQKNGCDLTAHQLKQADCLAWLEQPVDEYYDLIFLDPPSFSNSKKMDGVLDVQRDHVALIEGCMRRLEKNGLLIFSNNLKRFKLDPELETRYEIEDVSEASIDQDFTRNASIHGCWKIRHQNAQCNQNS